MNPSAELLIRKGGARVEVPSIAPLEPHSLWIAEIAARQFEHWGPLTGYSSVAEYSSFLQDAASSTELPRVLVATRCGRLLGSVNLLTSEMTVRPHLTPWLGQLYVMGSARGQGVGEALLAAAAQYVQGLGLPRLFLYTSGTLPNYYRAHGWSDVEELTYLGKPRNLMQLDLESLPSSR